MKRPDLNDLAAFVAVARRGSFTTAAAQLGISTSALSQTIRGLEATMGLRLLNRTTRQVTVTESGEKLLELFEPMLEDLDLQLEAMAALRERPAGNIRLTADEFALEAFLLPTISELLLEYPDIHIEVTTDYRLTDIVSERYDAGVRLAGIVAKDMIAIPIGPDQQSIIVGSPNYFKGRAAPLVPSDLHDHRCINLRLPTHGGLYAWELEENGRDIQVRVAGPITLNGLRPIVAAARSGLGLAHVPRDAVEFDLLNGDLVQVLSEYTPSYAGYCIYYQTRRHVTPAFQLLVDALKRNRGRYARAIKG
jgi:DNA-binding transcriptional LysR family regulator